MGFGKFVMVIAIIVAIGGTLLFSLIAVMVYVMYHKSISKNEDSVSMMHRGQGENLFSIWTYDGKLVYEDIISASEDFNDKYCIGRGESGALHKVELSTGQIVAVKRLHGFVNYTADQKSFINEIKLLTKMRHRNMVKFYGFCWHDHTKFLVYEYVEEGSLKNMLDTDESAAELDWDKRVNIVKGIAKALCYMHHGQSIPIVHRDITSNSVLLHGDFEACVSDFGIARLLREDSSNWTTVEGTYGYIAPELSYTNLICSSCFR